MAGNSVPSLIAAVAILSLAPVVRAADPDDEALPPHVTLQVVTLPDEKAKIISALQTSLDDIGFDARISDCELVVTYVDDLGSGRDSSYGADCTVKTAKGSQGLVMCDDWTIGRFTLTGGELGRERLGRFIRDNCPPGA